MPLRVAIDANVLISGIGWPRWQHEVLLHAVKGDYILVLSPIVLMEARRRIAVSFPDLTERFETILARIDYELAPVPAPEEVAANAGLMRHINDVPVALSVIAAQPDFFLTYDKDFTDENETTWAVRQAIPGIMLPPVFLRDYMGWTSEELEQVRKRDWNDFSDPNALNS